MITSELAAPPAGSVVITSTIGRSPAQLRHPNCARRRSTRRGPRVGSRGLSPGLLICGGDDHVPSVH